MQNIAASELHSYDQGITKYGMPIRNIWLLLLYASDLYRAGHLKGVGIETMADDVSAVVAELLCHHVQQRLRDALSQTYVPETAPLTRVRGRIELLRTEQQQLLRQGKVMCSFKTLTLNTPRNCFVRGALEHLANVLQNKVLRKRCVQLSRQLRLRGVNGRVPTLKQMWKERFGRHDWTDQPMFFAAKLAFQFQIPTEFQGLNMLSDYHRDEQALRKLFEKAVAGFYSVQLANTVWKVQAGKKWTWQIEDMSTGAASIMPGMETDIVLDNVTDQRRIIIDTKFTAILKAGQYRPATLQSGYIYQLYTYLRSQESTEDPLSMNSEGVLLHPSTGVDLDEFVIIQGHRLRFVTVDLGAEAVEVQRQLMAVLMA